MRNWQSRTPEQENKLMRHSIAVMWAVALLFSVSLCAAESIQTLSREIEELNSSIQDIEAQISTVDRTTKDLRAQEDSLTRELKMTDTENLQSLATIGSKADSLRQEVQSIESQLDGITQKQQELLQDSIAAHRRLQSALQTAQGGIDKIESQVNVHESRIVALRSQADALENRLASVQAALQDTMNAHQEKIAAHQRSIGIIDEKLQSAHSSVERAIKDSAELAQEDAQRLAGLKENLNAVSVSLTKVQRQEDSLSTAVNRLKSDSARTVDSLMTALTQFGQKISGFATSVGSDSTKVTSATTELNQARKDSLELVTQRNLDHAAHEHAIDSLDSLIVKTQDRKTRLVQVNELLELETKVTALREELSSFLKQPYEVRINSRGPEAEKEKRLNAYEGKLDHLRSTPELETLLSERTNTTPEKFAQDIQRRIDETERVLTLASQKRQQIASKEVIDAERAVQRVEVLARKIANLSQQITRDSRGLVNNRSSLENLRQDSASTVAALKEAQSRSHQQISTVGTMTEGLRSESASLSKKVEAATEHIAQFEAEAQQRRKKSSGTIEEFRRALKRVEDEKQVIVAKRDAARTDSTKAVEAHRTVIASVQSDLESVKNSIAAEGQKVLALEQTIESAQNDSIDTYNQVQAKLQSIHQQLQQNRREAERIGGVLSEKEGLFSVFSNDSSHSIQYAETKRQNIKNELREVARKLTTTNTQQAKLVAQKDQLTALKEQKVKRLAIAEKEHEAQLAKAQQQQRAQARKDSLASLPEQAESELLSIYEQIDKGQIALARRRFVENQALLENYLAPEAYQVITGVLESLESSTTPQASAPAQSSPSQATTPHSSAPSRTAQAPATQSSSNSPSQSTKPQQKASVEPSAPVGQEPKLPRMPSPKSTRPPVSDGSVFISSIPPAAIVYLDGHQIGRTNLGDIKITSGTHVMHFIKDDLVCVQEMTFSKGRNQSKFIRIPCE